MDRFVVVSGISLMTHDAQHLQYAYLKHPYLLWMA